jgi:ATP/ADP translocase
MIEFDYEAELERAAAVHKAAQYDAFEARYDLNAKVAAAHAGGVPLSTIMRLCGWKQPKSVYDAIRSYRTDGGAA